MKKNFTRFLAALALLAFFAPSVGMRAQVPVNTTLWEETWTGGAANTTPSNYNFTGTTVYGEATLTYNQSSTSTKLYAEKLAGGTSPELLLSKNNQTWTISNIPTGEATEMSLNFLSNKTTFDVTSTTVGITLSGSEKSWTISATSSVTNFNLTIKNTGSSNARIDNIVLTVTTAGGGTPTPTLTLSDSGTGNIGNYATNMAIYRDFTVTQNNLTDDITLSATNGGSFTINDEVVTSIPASSGYSQTEVRWHFTTPAEAGQFTSEITASSGSNSASCIYLGHAYAPHNVIIAEMEHGTVEANPTSAIQGEYVTLTVTPDQGYELEELTVVDGDDNEIEVDNLYRFQMPDSDVTVNATFVVPVQTQWILTNLADLTANDVFVIVGNGYAMTNNNGTTSAPSASAVTITGDEITSEVAANIQWNLSGDATNGYTFYPNGTTSTWLYCNTTASTGSNNNIRVGTGNRKVFELATKSNKNYLATKDDNTVRYVCVYNNADWRGYIENSIVTTNTTFYKKVTGGVVPPSITANNVEIEYNVTEGAIEYTINNGVEGGSLSATTTSDWLTLGDDFTSPIAFTCSANAAATARTATVTLTYTYGDNQTATKNVTVTQTGDPNYTPTIAEVRAQGTGAVVTKGVVTSCVGVTGYIQDATAAICVYGAELTVGDEIRVSGTLTTYKGLLEITSPEVTVISQNNTIEPTVMTIEEINTDYAGINAWQGWYVTIEDAIVTVIDGQNTTIAQGANTIVVRGISGVEYAVNDILTLDGNIGCYNATQIANPQNVTVQAAPAEPSITLISNDPTFTPESPYMIEFTHESGGGSSIDQVQCENFSSPLTEDDFSILFCDAEGNELTNQTAPDWILDAPSVTSESNNLYLGVTVDVNQSATARTCYFKVGAANGTVMVYSDLVTVNQAGFVATISVNPTVVNATAAETDGTITVTYTNIDFTNAPEIHWFEDAECTIALDEAPDWIDADINNDLNVEYLIEANDGEARTAYFKVYGLDIYVQEVYSNLVTINQAEYVVDYATLPFEFDGGRADIETTNGLTQEGLDSDYSSSPKLKFNTTGDWVILKINERPGTLTFDIKGNSFSGSTFTVQTSEDGETYTDLENYTSITGTQSEEFDNLGENVRYIKWIYTEKSSGNVALGNITLAEYVLVPSITVAPTEVNVDANEHDGTLDLTYENLTITEMGDFGIQYYDVAGEEASEPDWIEVTVAEQDPQVGEGYVVSYIIGENDGEARAAYFKVFAAGGEDFVYSNLVTVSQAAYVPPVEEPQFALFGGDLVEGDYIIYYDGRAMNNVVSSNRLQYAEIEPENNVITTDNAAIVWHIAPNNEGYWTIYSADANAYAASKDVKNQAQMLEDGTDDMAMWTVTEINGTYEFVNKKNAASGINANLRNNGTYGFACYATGTGGALSLYKYTETVATYTMEIAGYGDSEGGYYLIASPVLAVAPAADNGFLTDEYDLYYFDQTQDQEWRNYEAKKFNLVSGKGYLYASQENTTLTFTGVPYTGNGTIEISFDGNNTWGDENYFWNLVGNPFGQTAYIDRDFYAMNEDGSEIMTDANSGAIEAMKGIFVIAEEDGETLTFSTEAPNQSANLTMNLSQSRGAVIDRAIVRFNEGRQLPKFQLNAGSTKLYIPQGSKDYAVVRSANEGEMPVSFKAAENGTYTLNVEAKNVELTYLHLIDNLTGANVDLLANPSYTFEANKGDNANRFRLVFKANADVEDNIVTETFAYFNGSEWVISNTGDATLQVIDMMGRVLSSEQISGNTAVNINETAGIYMLRLVNGENVMVQKVVVR